MPQPTRDKERIDRGITTKERDAKKKIYRRRKNTAREREIGKGQANKHEREKRYCEIRKKHIAICTL